MSSAICCLRDSPSPRIPCLGGAPEPIYLSSNGTNAAMIKTLITVDAVFVVFLAFACLTPLPFAVCAGAACLTAAGFGALLYAALWLPSSALEKIAALKPAQRFAEGIEEELKEIIPLLEKRSTQKDQRITSLIRGSDTWTFILQDYPLLQFKMPIVDVQRKSFSTSELAKDYENAVYTREICRKNEWSNLVVLPTKVIYLTINGVRRPLLVEQMPQKYNLPEDGLQDANTAPYQLATDQMVQFLRLTGNVESARLPPHSFVPIEGGKFVVRGLQHLTSPQDPIAAGVNNLILGQKNSLLVLLDRKYLIDSALDTLTTQFNSRLTAANKEATRTTHYKLLQERNSNVNLDKSKT